MKLIPWGDEISQVSMVFHGVGSNECNHKSHIPTTCLQTTTTTVVMVLVASLDSKTDEREIYRERLGSERGYSIYQVQNVKQYQFMT